MDDQQLNPVPSTPPTDNETTPPADQPLTPPAQPAPFDPTVPVPATADPVIEPTTPLESAPWQLPPEGSALPPASEPAAMESPQSEQPPVEEPAPFVLPTTEEPLAADQPAFQLPQLTAEPVAPGFEPATPSPAPLQSLPLDAVPSQPVAPVNQSASQQPDHPSRLLLVEDDDALANVYVTRLQTEGFDVRRVVNGEEALSAALSYKPDLIILDVMMPKVSGFDVLDILRNTPETANVKIIMLTALSQDSDKERAQSLGADDYLVKSQVVIADVIDRIRHHLNIDQA